MQPRPIGRASRASIPMQTKCAPLAYREIVTVKISLSVRSQLALLLGAWEQRRSLNGYREVHAVRSACIMIEFRSDHACMIQNSETEWMHARGQLANARAWPAASGQLAGWRVASARVLGRSKATWRAQMQWAPCPLHLRAPGRFRSP